MNNLRAAIPFFMKIRRSVPPMISAINNVTRSAGYSAFTIQATLTSGTPPVTWSITGPAGVTITQSGLITIPAGLSVRSHTIRVQASNDAQTDTETFNVIVTAVAPSGTITLSANTPFGRTDLTWNHPSTRGTPIATYSVYRSRGTQGDEFDEIATNLTGTTYRDAGFGFTVRYYIRAENIAGSVDSNTLRVTR